MFQSVVSGVAAAGLVLTGPSSLDLKRWAVTP
jgi:hypothetical protein